MLLTKSLKWGHELIFVETVNCRGKKSFGLDCTGRKGGARVGMIFWHVSKSRGKDNIRFKVTSVLKDFKF